MYLEDSFFENNFPLCWAKITSCTAPCLHWRWTKMHLLSPSLPLSISLYLLSRKEIQIIWH